jgi:nucleoside-diphosphate-sugar epimerase
MKILVTGTEGYIGCRLAPYLVDRGHSVWGLDTGFYRDGWLYTDPRQTRVLVHTIMKDLRAVTAQDFEDFDAVIHLAELSNDPLGANRPEVTLQINHEGSVRIARLAKSAGVKRFIYASSCSVYGLGSGEFLAESASVNPQTAYARCKVLVEGAVAALADANFCPTYLRNATAFGASPRMRFDIVLNDLCARAWTTGKIAMTSDGTPWRPLVHIEDICEAAYRTLEAPLAAVHNQVFNVGQNSDNYQIRELAEIVASVFTGCEVTIGSSSGDNRSYRVSFDKIASKLPGFKCSWNARRGAEEFHQLFKRIDFTRADYEFRAFTRLKQLQHLQRTGQVDQDLFWTA